MATLGKRIRMLRKAAGMTQPKLASMSGVAQSTISEMENDLIPTPGVEVMSSLAAALRTNISWLMHGNGQPGPAENAIGFDEVEALTLIRKMDESHRESWLVSGRVLLTHQTGKASAHDPYSSRTPGAAPPPAKGRSKSSKT